jgi:IclR family transcriptional regulator, pca regulon regulatory protein
MKSGSSEMVPTLKPRRINVERTKFSPGDPRYSQSVERGLAILRCFTPERPLLGIAAIADELTMSRSTTHRYVITLVALGYLEQEKDRRYKLGVRVIDLGMAALSATGLREQARPLLEKLRAQVDLSASLAVLDSTNIVYVDYLPSSRGGQALELEIGPGSRLAAYSTAMGKVMLAHLPKAELDQLLGKLRLRKLGPGTITSKSALRTELAKLACTDLVVENEERIRGLVGIAAPIRDQSGRVLAAIDLTAGKAATSAPELERTLGAVLLSSAASISERFGYSPS